MNVFINNYNINYIEEGNGDNVLLLHGWGSNYKCFLHTIDVLKNKYHVFAIDLPGFGNSDDLKSSFCVDNYVKIVDSFINDVIIRDSNSKNIILIGHSYGGRIIIKLNCKENLLYNITKNVLIDSAGLKDKKDIKVIIKIYIFKLIKKIITILPIKNKTAIIDKYRNKFGSSDYNDASLIMKETLIKSVNENLESYLNKMKETLIIWGKFDTVTPFYMAKIMNKHIKNSGIVVLNGGHFSFIDDIVTYEKVLKSYFNI